MISSLQKGQQPSTRKRASKLHPTRLRVCQLGPRGGALAKCGPLISSVWRTDCTLGNQYNKSETEKNPESENNQSSKSTRTYLSLWMLKPSLQLIMTEYTLEIIFR